MATCSVEGCGGIIHARGWCSKHYMRWRIHGDPLTTLHGAAKEFIEMALNNQDKEVCLHWPFARNEGGYARKSVGDTGDGSVSRYICNKVYGPPPSTKHEAAHNCGKGHLGCINPHHLEWKTHAGNEADKIIHGTDNRGERCGNAILTWEKVREIRSMKGKLSGAKVATIFGVDHVTIHKIWYNKTWKE